MKVETQTQDNRTLNLTVEVDDERVQPALRAAARRIAKQVKIPGFRPGKAPYEMVVRHVGENNIYSEALEDLGQKVYQEALEQESIDAFGPGELADIQLKPMVLKFTVPLRPEIDLGDYRANLRVAYTPPAISDESLEQALERLRERHAELAPVERPAQMGDVATLDAKGYLHAGENPSDFLLADKDVALLLDEKAEWPMPGFAAQLVALSAGESKTFDLTFPADYANESLRGEMAHFEVTVKEVKQRTLPEWSDELAKAIDSDHENLESLRAAVRQELVQQAEADTRRQYADEVVKQLVDQASVAYPPVLLEHELDDYLEDLDRRLHEQRLTLDDYLKIEKKTREAFREELRPQAEARLKRTLVLGKVIDLEQLDVSADEISSHIDRVSAPWGERSAEVQAALGTDQGRRMISMDMLTDKAIDRLMAIARGDEVPPLPAAGSQPAAEAQPAAETEPAGETEPGSETQAAAEIRPEDQPAESAAQPAAEATIEPAGEPAGEAAGGQPDDEEPANPT